MSATTPAMIPSMPISVLIWRMSASIGVVPSGRYTGKSVKVSPAGARTARTSSTIARNDASSSSTAVIASRFVAPPAASAATVSSGANAVSPPDHQSVSPTPTMEYVVPSSTSRSPGATPASPARAGDTTISSAATGWRPAPTTTRSMVRSAARPTSCTPVPVASAVTASSAWPSAADTFGSAAIRASWPASSGVVGTMTSPSPLVPTAACSEPSETCGIASTPMAPTASARANTLARMRPGRGGTGGASRS